MSTQVEREASAEEERGQMHVKSFRMKVDSVDEENGTFDAYASVFNVLDSDAEIVMPGAFNRSLKNNQGVVVLADHDVKKHIGFNIEAHEDGYGLRVKAQLALDNSAARDKYALIKLAQKLNGQGLPVKAGISIGFRAIQTKMMSGRELKSVKGADPNRTYLCFTECALVEYSVVALAANQEAYVTAAKARYDENSRKFVASTLNATAEGQHKKDFAESLAEAQSLTQLYKERCTFESALYDATQALLSNDQLSTDEKKTEIAKSYEQYAAAMSDWYSRFIDADQDNDPEEDDMENMDGKNEKAGRSISAATAKQIKQAMGHMADASAMHQKALDILSHLSHYDDVNLPNPVGGGSGKAEKEKAEISDPEDHSLDALLEMVRSVAVQTKAA